MTIDKAFFVYMAVAGAAAGALLVAAPQTQDFAVKPYFWVIIAVVAFDLANFARGRGAPETMLSMQARLLGFVIGVVLMVVIPTLAQAPVRFF